MVNYACSQGLSTWRPAFRFQLLSRSQCSNSHGEHHCLRDYALSSQAGAQEEEKQVGRGVVWTSIPMIESRLPCAVKGTIPHNGLTVTLRNREMASFLEIVLPGLGRRAPDGCARWWGWVGPCLKRLVGFHQSVFNRFSWQDMVFQGVVATGAITVASSDQCLGNLLFKPSTTLQQVYRASKSPRYEDGSNVYIHAATGGKTGLQNGGATCYLNAVIQVLTSISFLTQYFLCGEWMKDCRVDESLPWEVWFDVFIAAVSQTVPTFHPRTFKMDNPMSAPAWFLVEAVCFDKVWNQHRYFSVVAGNMLILSFILVGHETCTEHWFAIKLGKQFRSKGNKFAAREANSQLGKQIRSQGTTFAARETNSQLGKQFRSKGKNFAAREAISQLGKQIRS